MKTISSRIVLGVTIIAVGVMLLLDTLGVPGLNNILSTWWPIFVILAGLVSLINGPKNYLWPVILVVFGTFLQLNELGILGFSPWQIIWPTLVIMIGLSIIFDKGRKIKNVNKSERQDIVAVLGGNEQKNNSTNYKGSKITAIMGGAMLDLRKATIEKEATIEVTTFCGGIEIRVPKNVIIKDQTNSVLGGVENKVDAPESEKAPIIHIVGDVILGGLEIKD